jgi:hypothetical protein
LKSNTNERKAKKIQKRKPVESEINNKENVKDSGRVVE